MDSSDYVCEGDDLARIGIEPAEWVVVSEALVISFIGVYQEWDQFVENYADLGVIELDDGEHYEIK